MSALGGPKHTVPKYVTMVSLFIMKQLVCMMSSVSSLRRGLGTAQNSYRVGESTYKFFEVLVTDSFHKATTGACHAINHSPHCFLRQSLSLNRQFTYLTTLASIGLLRSQFWDHRHKLPCLTLYTDAGNPNAGPHTRVASTLPPEPSPSAYIFLSK